VLNEYFILGVVHTYNPSSWEAEAGESLVGGHPGLPSKTLSQQQEKNEFFILLMRFEFYYTVSSGFMLLLGGLLMN
jgi:hypothetical protein